MQSGSTMPPSEAVYRSLKNAAAVLYHTHGLSHAEVDAAMRESFALFWAGRALESCAPRRFVDELVAAIERHLDNHGLSAAVRSPVRRFLGRFRRAAAPAG